MSVIESFLLANSVSFEKDVPLTGKTWIRTGGMCKYWIVPDGLAQLETVCRFLYAEKVEFDVVGYTSNLFYHKDCNPDVIVSTVKVNNYEITGDRLVCDCGVSVVRLAKECLEKGYAGFCGLVGLPGTVASAAVNNAGCFGCSISSMLRSVRYLNTEGNVDDLTKEQMEYSKRSSVFKRKQIRGVVLSLELDLTKAQDIAAEKEKAEASVKYRKIHQEQGGKNLGSVFAQIRIRRNLKSLVATGISKLASLLRIAPYGNALKKTLLRFYGCRNLDGYISDKNINTFIWRDDEAENRFEEYKAFMGKAFRNLKIEIEEKTSRTDKMKVGILTYHRAENYGALLQAFALRTYLKGLGFDVDFVDYWPDYHSDFFKIFPWKRFKAGSIYTKAVCLYLATVWGIPRSKRKCVMKDFMSGYLGLADRPRYVDDSDVCDCFDCVVYGSDQIWRQQNLPGHKGLDFWYFGSPNVQARKIAYAASMGPSNLSDKEKEDIKSRLTAFEALSVRESSLQETLASLGFVSEVVVDPVFLLSREQWGKVADEAKKKVKGRKYILFYNLLNSNESSRFADRLGKAHGLRIIEITKKYGIRYLGKRYSHTASVPEFLSLIRNAEYVVSNSFHGVAMSIIFEKQFFAVGMGKRSDRVESLLKVLDLGERYIKHGDSAPLPDIDYQVVRPKLEDYASRSKRYLMDSIGEHIENEGNITGRL
ncbi:MAG: polysaccharide pyruvyl transferase family protein [Bacteroidales bacterium]|nr:polysaccharide pyruvyl transferase family protein [Bacteroidales bacterium]